jgi:hypothetical protein
MQSFVVGSLTSGTAFLVIHQQLSYRERLTKKWPVMEQFENQINAKWKSMIQDLRATERRQLTEMNLPSNTSSFKRQWNGMLDQIQEYLYSKKDD